MVVRSEKLEGFDELGLTSTESKLFNLLLREGALSGSKAAALLGLHKSAAYFCIEQLCAKGLATAVAINGVKHFRPVERSVLNALIGRRRKQFDSGMAALAAVLSRPAARGGHAEFRIFEDWDGMRAAFDVILSGPSGDEYVVYGTGAPESLQPRFRTFIRNVHSKRVKAGIACRLLLSDSRRDTIGRDRMREPCTGVRFLKSEASPLLVNVRGAKVLLAIWTKPPLGILIESKEVADSFGQFFELLWRQGK